MSVPVGKCKRVCVGGWVCEREREADFVRRREIKRGRLKLVDFLIGQLLVSPKFCHIYFLLSLYSVCSIFFAANFPFGKHFILTILNFTKFLFNLFLV